MYENYTAPQSRTSASAIHETGRLGSAEFIPPRRSRGLPANARPKASIRAAAPKQTAKGVSRRDSE